MRCPNCGNEVGEAPFCPQCGTDMSSSVRRHRVFRRNVDRGLRHVTSAVVILLAVVSVLMVVASAVPVPTQTEEPAYGPPEGSVVMDDGSYIVLSEGFEDSGLSLSPDDAGQLVISLSYEGEAETYVWEFRDDCSAKVSTITKDTPVLTWMTPTIGSWTVTVYCNAEGETVDIRTGSFVYYADRDSRFSWTHQGRTMSVSHTVLLKDYLTLSAYPLQKGDDTLSYAASRVSAEEVSDLESKIWAVYTTAFGGVRTSSDYMTCLAEFVSSCFDVREDCVSRGVSVYTANPLETLYLGYGDSCDLSILMASLIKAALVSGDRPSSMNVGIVKMPGFWAVGIGVREASSIVVDGVTTISIVLDGEKYWITSVTPYTGLGQVPDCFGYEGGFTYYGSPASAGCGLQKV